MVCGKYNIMLSIQQRKLLAHFLLDLSPVFDTLDYNILFSRLKEMLNLSVKALEWFQPYLEQQTHGIFT